MDPVGEAYVVDDDKLDCFLHFGELVYYVESRIQIIKIVGLSRTPLARDLLYAVLFFQ